MAAIYATKKSGGFLKNNWKNLLIGGAVLFIGYKVSQGFKSIGSVFNSLPSLSLPQITLPTLPDIGGMLGLTGQDPSLHIMQGMPVDPNRITYTPITTMGNPVTSFMQDMMGNILQNGMMQSLNIVEAGGTLINPNLQSMAKDYAPIDIASVDLGFKKPIMDMLKMGLAIDVPTKQGISPMATLLDKVTSMVQRVPTAQALVQGGGVLTMLSAQNPNLTASQLADLRFRLGNEGAGFDFGTNTGAGRLPIFDVMGQTVIATQRNPVLQAYENYKAMYGSA